MIQDREMVVQAVLEGILTADYLTDSEVQELEVLVGEAAMEQELEQAAVAGKAVFWGLDGDPLQ